MLSEYISPSSCRLSKLRSYRRTCPKSEESHSHPVPGPKCWLSRYAILQPSDRPQMEPHLGESRGCLVDPTSRFHTRACSASSEEIVPHRRGWNPHRRFDRLRRRVYLRQHVLVAELVWGVTRTSHE